MIVAALALMLALQDQSAFSSDVKLVTVPCIIKGADGVAMQDLTPADVRLFDNGVRQEIRKIWTEADLPLAIGVVLDTSGSQRAFTREHETLAAQFLERMVRPEDHAFVVTVAEETILRSEVTGGPYGLRRILSDRVGQSVGERCGKYADGRPICGGTALWNAVHAVAERLQRFDGSRAMLILSDGNDTGSNYSLDAAIATAQESNVIVYSIQYPDGGSVLSSPGGLARLSDATGGLLFAPGDNIVARIEADLHRPYILGFYAQPGASNAPARHEIRVETVRTDITIRAQRESFEILPM